jgi:hypothetical protein
MKTVLKRLLMSFLLAFGFINNNEAQELPEAQKNLQRFVGNWECKNASMTLGDKIFSGPYFINCKSVIDGKGIYVEERFENAELGNLNGLNIVSYDPNLQNIHWYSIDNQGTCHDHTGYWTDKDHLYMQYQGIVEGTIFVEKIYFTFFSDNKLEFKLTGENNGVVTQKGTGEFVKK